MNKERGKIREYFDSVEMTEEFRQRLLALPRRENASPKACPQMRSWKPLAVAAVLVLVSLAGIPLLREQKPAVPLSPTETQTAASTAAVVTQPITTGTEHAASVPPTVPATTGPQFTDPAEPSSTAAPPLPSEPGGAPEPTAPPAPTNPPLPPRPADPVLPSQPVTEPSNPITEPPVPVTEPYEPVTEPPEPVTESPEQDTEPPIPETVPMPSWGGAYTPSDFGWTYEVLSSENSELLIITETATGEVCEIDLSGFFHDYDDTVFGTCTIFGRVWNIVLQPSPEGSWIFYLHSVE